MGLESETGKYLHTVLTKLINNNPESALDKLKRVLIVYSSEIEDTDNFISLLYGQSVLDETPFSLSQRVPTTLLRIQHAIETSLKKNCVKELIVALERSKSEGVLNKVLKWAEKSVEKLQVSYKHCSTRLVINITPFLTFYSF